MRNLLKWAVAACAGAALVSLAPASPAQAVTYVRYASSHHTCISGTTNDDLAFLTDCGTSASVSWQIENRPQSGTSNMVVKLRNRNSGACLDSDSNTNGGSVWVHGCNTGNNQLWEVFYNSNGTRTFKSWGSWKGPRRHLCLYDADNRATLKTCDANAARQQWIRQG